MVKTGDNIYKRKDGRWEGRYAKERIEDKIQYGYVFGKSYEEVEKKLSDASTQILNITDSINATFKGISNEWLNTKKPELKASSIAKYTNILELYLIPEYGSRQINAISRNEISRYSRGLLTAGGTKSKGLSPKTINGIISVVKNVMGYAKREKSLTVADMKGVSVKQPQKPMRVLSRVEQQKISQYLCDNPSPCHLGILLCLYTGMRIGEICALRWEDVCFEEQYLFVRQSMQRIQRMDGGEKKTEIMILPPKSDCSIRKIPIPEQILQFLLPEQKEDEAFLLTGKVCSYVEPRCMENYFKTVVRKCDIKDVNFHALRHTFATRCVELEFDIKSLSEILGHASVNITLNRYVHPSMELKQRNMNKLSCLLATK